MSAAVAGPVGGVTAPGGDPPRRPGAGKRRE